MMILDLKDPSASRGGRALVDTGAVAGGRRSESLDGRPGAALPSPDAHGRPALRELLASRLPHSRHLRHVEAEAHRERQHLARLSASDAYLPADSADAQGPQGHGGRGRGRRQALAVGAGVRLDLRHHQRALPRADLDLPGRRPRSRRRAAAAHHGLPPALRALQGDHHSRSRGSRKGCASSTSRIRSRRARWPSTRRIRRRASASPPRTTSPSTIAAFATSSTASAASTSSKPRYFDKRTADPQ